MYIFIIISSFLCTNTRHHIASSSAATDVAHAHNYLILNAIFQYLFVYVPPRRITEKMESLRINSNKRGKNALVQNIQLKKSGLVSKTEIE